VAVTYELDFVEEKAEDCSVSCGAERDGAEESGAEQRSVALRRASDSISMTSSAAFETDGPSGFALLTKY
jgi:hypothetical protein